MRLRNKIDRFSLLKEIITFLDNKNTNELVKYIEETLEKHYKYVKEVGIDLEEITNFSIQ